jgi:hypothetical protein
MFLFRSIFRLRLRGLWKFGDVTLDTTSLKP